LRQIKYRRFATLDAPWSDANDPVSPLPFHAYGLADNYWSASASAIHRATAVARLDSDARRANTHSGSADAGCNTYPGSANADAGCNTYPGSADTDPGRNAYPGGADTGGRNRARACDAAFRYTHGLAINNGARRRRGNCEAQRYECNQTSHHILQIDTATKKNQRVTSGTPPRSPGR
jgi:hypothetical protein